MTAQVQHWHDLGLSLRQIQQELAQTLHTSLGLRTLNERLQQVKTAVEGALRAVPPVVMLDALWVTVLVPTGQTQPDGCGRQRAVKRKRKVAVLVALGVWPQTGAWKVLDWSLAPAEDQTSWEALLVRLETRGVYAERGLHLLIHDGGAGLEAALRLVFPLVRRQRCIFHKLRNIWRAVALPDALPRPAARRVRRQIIRQAAAIYRAPDEPTARARLHAFWERWQVDQPQVVATIQREVEATLQFFALLRRFPHWRATALRTTSLLERLNRRLRRLFRVASAFHSHQGLAVATARVLMPLAAS